MTSLREYLEAIRDRNAGVEGSIDDSPFDYRDAVAALAILDAAATHYPRDLNHRYIPAGAVRLVPDPEAAS